MKSRGLALEFGSISGSGRMNKGYLCGKQCTRQRKTLQYGTLECFLLPKSSQDKHPTKEIPKIRIVTVLFNSQAHPFFGLPYNPTAHYQMIHLLDKCLLSIYCVLGPGEKDSEQDSCCTCPHKVKMFYREGKLKRRSLNNKRKKTRDRELQRGELL